MIKPALSGLGNDKGSQGVAHCNFIFDSSSGDFLVFS